MKVSFDMLRSLFNSFGSSGGVKYLSHLIEGKAEKSSILNKDNRGFMIGPSVLDGKRILYRSLIVDIEKGDHYLHSDKKIDDIMIEAKSKYLKSKIGDKNYRKELQDFMSSSEFQEAVKIIDSYDVVVDTTIVEASEKIVKYK